MRRLFCGGLVVLAGVALDPTPGPSQSQALVVDYRGDARLQALHKFFGKTGCPAKAYSNVFLEAADDYDLDWRLLPSISFIESTGGKAARNNNLFGWDNGNARFASPTEGIHKVGYLLAKSARYRDKDLDELLEIYNPNVDYGRKVKSVMRRISPAE